MKQTDWFYKTDTWQRCREAYIQKAGGLCEICYAKGLIVPGEIVHHKIHLNGDNVTEPNISLNFDNLQLVCRECHGNIHRKNKKRFSVDKLGNVTIKDTPP